MEISKMTIADLKASRDFVLELIIEAKNDTKLFENDRSIEHLEKLQKKIRETLFYKVMALNNAK